MDSIENDAGFLEEVGAAILRDGVVSVTMAPHHRPRIAVTSENGEALEKCKMRFGGCVFADKKTPGSKRWEISGGKAADLAKAVLPHVPPGWRTTRQLEIVSKFAEDREARAEMSLEVRALKHVPPRPFDVDDADLDAFCGAFVGDGTVFVGSAPCFTIAAAENRKESLHKYRDLFGGSITVEKKAANDAQDLHRWRLSGSEAVFLAREMLRFMPEGLQKTEKVKLLAGYPLVMRSECTLDIREERKRIKGLMEDLTQVPDSPLQRPLTLEFVAGLVDTDGHVRFEKEGVVFRPVLSVRRKHPALLEALKARFGGTLDKNRWEIGIDGLSPESLDVLRRRCWTKGVQFDLALDNTAKSREELVAMYNNRYRRSTEAGTSQKRPGTTPMPSAQKLSLDDLVRRSRPTPKKRAATGA